MQGFEELTIKDIIEKSYGTNSTKIINDIKKAFELNLKGNELNDYIMNVFQQHATNEQSTVRGTGVSLGTSAGIMLGVVFDNCK